MPTPVDLGSTVTTRIKSFYREEVVSTATGFFYRGRDGIFLITNWHVVAGCDFRTRKLLHSMGAIPDRIEYQVNCQGELGEWMTVRSPLYSDSDTTDQPEHPLWLEHPVHRHALDVVAIPIMEPAAGAIRTIDLVDTVPKMILTVSRDVFIIGYPGDIVGDRGFPIWKRASIATEPKIYLDGMPKLLVDTATRQGMSGAPVIAIADGEFDVEGPQPAYRKPGRVYRFVGVYSGRLGKDEMQAQLGIVWHRGAVDEVATVGTVGVSSFLLDEVRGTPPE